jgi:hypothetical protein
MWKNFEPEKDSASEFKLIVASLLIPYFISFYILVGSPSTSVNGLFQGCWSYIPHCDKLYFLQALPFGYSQTIFYAGIFLVLLLAIEGLIKNRWKQVWWMLFILFLWKIFTLFVIGTQPGNFDYYDVVLSIVVLFFPFKLWFTRLAFVLLYFLASTIKIHEGWILGTYFTSLETGLAIFGNDIAPLITMTVVLMQMVGSWFLLSRNENVRSYIFFFFFAFHLYSSIYVGWRYPTSDLFMLATLFYLHKNPPPVPIHRKSMIGYVFLALLIVIQFIPKTIPGDQKFTLEANSFGLYMFEANHQCISTVSYTDKEGSLREDVDFSINAKNRCNPSFYLQRIKRECDSNEGISLAWTFDHSINGGPFYRMINTSNACLLEYKTFRKNDWIRYKREEMEIVGYPLKNFYY